MIHSDYMYEDSDIAEKKYLFALARIVNRR